MFEVNVGSTRISLGLWAGLALVSLAVYLYINAKVSARPYYSEPLAFPIAVEPKTIWASHMNTYLTRRYDIVIDIEGQQLRTSTQWEDCDISWKLWDGARLVAENGPAQKSFQNYGGMLEAVIGSFQGEKGHHYSFVMQADPKKPEPEIARATLKVQTPRADWEGDLAIRSFKELAAAIAWMFGGVMILDWFFRRRKPDPSPASQRGQ
jgi:hypothetical protein